MKIQKVLAVFALLAVPCLLMARGSGDDGQAAIRNVSFKGTDSSTVITYDLLCDRDLKSTIRVRLRRQSDTSFVYEPVHLRGAVGANIVPGERLTIIWDSYAEAEKFPDQSDYYFEVEAAVPAQAGIPITYWIGGAAVAVVGTVVYLVASHHGGDAPPVEADGFGNPPVHP